MSDEIYQITKGVTESVSGPLCKLIDAVRAGAGLLYEPVHHRRMAKAEGDALVIRAKCELELRDLKERAAARLTNTETRRQQNIESILEESVKHLPESCSDDPVDQDWMADFFDNCKDIGNEQVQRLWGKLLANEVSEPGSFSRRGLNTLKLMSSSEAALFYSIGWRVWRVDKWPALMIPGSVHPNWPAACPFHWSHIQKLVDVDILERTVNDELRFIGSGKKNWEFEYHGQRWIGFTTHLEQSAPHWVNFTSLGNELLPLVEQPAGINDEYFVRCSMMLSKEAWQRDSDSQFRNAELPDDLIRELDLNRPPTNESTDVAAHPKDQEPND